MWSEAKQLRTQRLAYYHQAGEKFSSLMFGRQLAGFIGQVREEQGKRDVLFLCIGSDRSTGDSLGPLVGYKLEKRGEQARLMGTLKQPVHAINLEEAVSRIGAEYRDSVVVAVDASIGRHEHVGYITLGWVP